MIERTLTVTASLEARTAALFVQTAGKFNSQIKVQVENKTANAKSIMGIISLGILDGQALNIIAEGNDEDQAVNELDKFLNNV